MRTILLLTISNVFMTFAWYGHLKYTDRPLWLVILVSWGIAFFEYCFQVPANRIGHAEFTTTQLKVIQEVITLLVFSVFLVTYMREELRWNYLVGFAFLVAAVFFVFAFRTEPSTDGARKLAAATVPWRAASEAQSSPASPRLPDEPADRPAHRDDSGAPPNRSPEDSTG